MSALQYIVEPQKLVLTWQPPEERIQPRTRRVVGEVYPNPNQEGYSFRYLKDTPDYEEALKAGFLGFPAFDQKDDTEIQQGVLESLLRRLPPRRREDFDQYLARQALPVPFEHSDFALLGYTGGKLPSDGFALVPMFEPDKVPCDYLLEVAGTRHVFEGDTSALRVGEPVSFELDAGNPVDSDAMAVFYEGQRIGYVNRAMRQTVRAWLENHTVNASVYRLNGKPQRPIIYVKLSVR